MNLSSRCKETELVQVKPQYEKYIEMKKQECIYYSVLAFCYQCCCDFWINDNFMARLHEINSNLVRGVDPSPEDLSCIDYLLEVVISAWEQSRRRLLREVGDVQAIPIDIRQSFQDSRYEKFTIELYSRLLVEIKKAETLAKRPQRRILRNKRFAQSAVS